jgi:hypothetical protein
MFFGPRLPSRYPLLLLRKPFRFGKGIPCCHSRVRLAAEKYRKKCVVRTHEISFPLRIAGPKQKLDIAVQMVDASGGDVCAAPGLGQYEGALQNSLRVQRAGSWPSTSHVSGKASSLRRSPDIKQTPPNRRK